MTVESATSLPTLDETLPADTDLFKFGAAHIRLLKQLLKTEFVRGTFTPTVTFATPGDFSPTYITQVGHFVKFGGMLFFSLHLQWTNNAFSTASGACTIGGFPHAAKASSPATQSVAIGRLDKATLAATIRHIALLFTAGGTTVTLAASRSGALATFNLTTAQIPAGTTNMLLTANGIYEVD